MIILILSAIKISELCGQSWLNQIGKRVGHVSVAWIVKGYVELGKTGPVHECIL